MASVRRLQKLRPCQIKTDSARSKMVLLLPKAEPISGAPDVSLMAYLRKVKKM